MNDKFKVIFQRGVTNMDPKLKGPWVNLNKWPTRAGHLFLGNKITQKTFHLFKHSKIKIQTHLSIPPSPPSWPIPYSCEIKSYIGNSLPLCCKDSNSSLPLCFYSWGIKNRTRSFWCINRTLLESIGLGTVLGTKSSTFVSITTALERFFKLQFFKNKS